MDNNNPEFDSKKEPEAVTKVQERTTLKNHNPNQNHNTKKVSLGPNTKR